MIPVIENGCYCFTLETTGTIDIFIKPMYKQIIVHSLNHFIDSKGMIVYGWCLMSNKLYIVCQSQNNTSISELREEFSVFTCQKIIETIKEDKDDKAEWFLKYFEKPASLFDGKTHHSCWGTIATTAQLSVNNTHNLSEQLEFIHALPVKERFVQYTADYLYSSARDYAGMPGLVKTTRPTAVENELHQIENQKISFRANYNY